MAHLDLLSARISGHPVRLEAFLPPSADGAGSVQEGVGHCSLPLTQSSIRKSSATPVAPRKASWTSTVPTSPTAT